MSSDKKNSTIDSIARTLEKTLKPDVFKKKNANQTDDGGDDTGAGAPQKSYVPPEGAAQEKHWPEALEKEKNQPEAKREPDDDSRETAEEAPEETVGTDKSEGADDAPAEGDVCVETDNEIPETQSDDAPETGEAQAVEDVTAEPLNENAQEAGEGAIGPEVAETEQASEPEDDEDEPPEEDAESSEEGDDEDAEEDEEETGEQYAHRRQHL